MSLPDTNTLLLFMTAALALNVTPVPTCSTSSPAV